MKMKSLAVVDVIGALAALACAAVGVGFGLIGSDQTAQRIDSLTNQSAQLNSRLEGLSAALHRQKDLLQQRTAAFGARDLLPETSSADQELRAVTDLARTNGLEVTGMVPMGYWDYPGIREVRYRMNVTGSYAGFVRFLDAFERAASWSDVTYIKLASDDPRDSNDKHGELTLSLYAAAPQVSAGTGDP